MKGERLIGRGVEDNQQSLVASLFAAACLQELGLEPARTARLLFVSDEETGSAHGAWHVARDDAPFHPRGQRPGARQRRARRLRDRDRREEHPLAAHRAPGESSATPPPRTGAINAFEAGSHLVVRLGGLAGAFPQVDRLFDPSVSTFAPTKKEANVPNINTIPGEDAFCVDCRVLPLRRPRRRDGRDQEDRRRDPARLRRGRRGADGAACIVARDPGRRPDREVARRGGAGRLRGGGADDRHRRRDGGGGAPREGHPHRGLVAGSRRPRTSPTSPASSAT